MSTQFSYFDKVIRQVEEYLYLNLCFTPTHIDFCRRDWNRIRIFLLSKGYNDFSIDHEQEIRNYFQPHNLKGRASRACERMNMSITIICQFVLTDKVSIKSRYNKSQLEFEGPIGNIIEQFLLDLRKVKRLSYIRTRCYKRQLTKLYIFCKSKNIKSIHEIDLAFLLKYIKELDIKYKTDLQTAMGILKGFTKYLYTNKIIKVDYSISMPKFKAVYQPNISSTYTAEEIELLLKSIDRISVSGKRNYAMILLMARLGLRASDVCNLKFECLDWKAHTITLTQIKTGRGVILPLLPDVGNAIIDYLKYSRPQSEENFIFLSCVSPFLPFITGRAIGSRVRDIFKKAGIKTEGKKYGSHALRHSLGFRLLQESTAIPVISEILGHQNSQSTKYYLRIDIQSMRICMLDVPPVTKEFYEQKENIFYG